MQTALRRLTLGTWLALAASGALDCEPRAQRGPAAPAAPAVRAASEVCAVFARTYCDRLEHCAPYELRSELGTLATCVERFATYCAHTQRLSGSGFDDARVKQCTAGLDDLACGFFRPLPDVLVPACHPTGTQPTGARCLDDRQCQTGYCLRLVPDPAPCGVCAPRAPTNGECWSGMPGSPRQGCQLGEVCSRGHCLGPMKNEGEPCGIASPWTTECYGDTPTGQWLTCQAPAPQPDYLGVCRRFGAVERCSQSADCEPNGWCEAGKCRPRVGLASGAACGDERSLCEAGLCVNGHCQAAPSEGLACDEDVTCGFPYVCSAGVCRLGDPSCE
jgi:hypothetical protein